MHLILVFCTE